nr:sigma-70 family RNA polymerase sigma factor [Lysinibacter cavernae]
MEARSDTELVIAYRLGDESAATALFERHYTDVLNSAGNVARNRLHAEEFASEAFTKVLEAIRRGKGPTEHFRGYLRQALRNIAIDYYQDSSNYITVDDFSEVQEETTPDSSALFEAGDSEVVSAFRNLPERYRQILYLGLVEGRSGKEIAEFFDLNEGAVRVLMHRAKDGLRLEYLEQVARVATFGACAGRCKDLAKRAVHKLSAKREAVLVQHLAGCVNCRAADENLEMLVERFNSKHVGGVLAGVAGAVVLPSFTKLGGGSAAAALFTFSKTVAAAPLMFGAVAATVVVVVGGTVVAGATTAQRNDVIEVPSGTGTCKVTLEATHESNEAGRFLARNSGNQACTVGYSLNGRVLVDEADVRTDYLFVATQPGTYSVTINVGERSETHEFAL